MKPSIPALLAAALVLLPAAPASAQTPQPYRDPPFTCDVVDYGTRPPPVPGPSQDPLCVRYDKSNITLTDLGAVDFLRAEPGRVAIAAGKCSYWQQDHWVVRATPDAIPLLEWHGSYWYDARSGAGGGIARGLRVNGLPVDGHAFIDAFRPIFGDDAADQLAPYAADGGGGGASFTLPGGFGDGCRAPSPSPAADRLGGAGTDAAAASGSLVSAEVATRASSPDVARASTTLPDTGGSDLTAAVALALAVALLARRAARLRPARSGAMPVQ